MAIYNIYQIIMQSIDVIFEIIKNQYSQLDLKLASWWLYDAKWVGTSDVDILRISSDLEAWKNIFQNIINIDISPDRHIYQIWWFDRDVNIYVTISLSWNRSLIHRQNEIMLNSFDFLASQALILKKNWMWTEPAWATVLWLSWDPYEAMTRDDLYDIATQKSEELKSYISNLPKNI